MLPSNCNHGDCVLQEMGVDEALSQVEGESLGDMLDFLSKELIRLQVINYNSILIIITVVIGVKYTGLDLLSSHTMLEVLRGTPVV